MTAAKVCETVVAWPSTLCWLMYLTSQRRQRSVGFGCCVCRKEGASGVGICCNMDILMFKYVLWGIKPSSSALQDKPSSSTVQDFKRSRGIQ
jgi:hypothetical protein